MKKIVVILAQPIEYNTSSMIRCRSIMNELPALGWEVTCYAPHPDTSNMYYDQNAIIESKIHIVRYGTCPRGIKTITDSKRTVKRVILRGLYCLYRKVDLFGSSIRYIKYRKYICREMVNKDYQKMLSFSNPMVSHIIAGYCKKKTRDLYYVQQWGDPLTEDVTDHTIIPGFIKRFIEGKLLKYADKVCYVSPLTYERQKELFKKYSDKMNFTPTPCEKKEYPSHHNQKLSVGYLGSYNQVARDIRPFYNAACRSKDFTFIFIGDSDVQLENTENIQVIKRLPQKELEKYIAELDILVCLMNSGGTQIPGKLYHYAGTNKEILVIRDGEYGEQIESFFKRFNRYTFAENKEEKIMETLRRYIVNGLPNRCCVEEFCAKRVAEKLIELIDKQEI